MCRATAVWQRWDRLLYGDAAASARPYAPGSGYEEFNRGRHRRGGDGIGRGGGGIARSRREAGVGAWHPVSGGCLAEWHAPTDRRRRPVARQWVGGRHPFGRRVG